MGKTNRKTTTPVEVEVVQPVVVQEPRILPDLTAEAKAEAKAEAMAIAEIDAQIALPRSAFVLRRP